MSRMKVELQEDETLLMTGQQETSKVVILLTSGKGFVVTATDNKLCIQSFPNKIILSDLALDRVCVSYEDS